MDSREHWRTFLGLVEQSLELDQLEIQQINQLHHLCAWQLFPNTALAISRGNLAAQ
jgi:hypothetical protein